MGQIYQFGEFGVDPVRRVLLRDGEPVQITPKAFSILLLLLESRGRTVTKDELTQGAWSGAHVSDANLMQNISSLRKALGERAGDARYIVTIPGQGYRFTGDVAEVADEEPAALSPLSPPAPAQLAPALPAPEVPAPAASSPPTPPAPPRLPRLAPHRRTVFPIVVGAVLFLLGASAFVVWRQGAPSRLSDAVTDSGMASRPALAILGLRNLSGNRQAERLGPALAELLGTELAAGGQVQVIPGEDMAQARSSLGDPQGLDAASLQKLRDLTGADLVIDGSYLVLPGKRTAEGDPSARSRVRLDLRLLSVPHGEVVASVAEVGEENDLAALVARAGIRLRRFLDPAEPT